MGVTKYKKHRPTWKVFRNAYRKGRVDSMGTIWRTRREARRSSRYISKWW